MTRNVPSVSVNYAQNGSSTTSKELGMRAILERIYFGRLFRNDTERLEKLFELCTKMTTKVGAA